MKKLLVLLIFMLFVTIMMVGCSNVNNSVRDATSGESNNDNQTEAIQKPSELPAFEELVALNSYENILKEHSTLYVKNTCTVTNAE